MGAAKKKYYVVWKGASTGIFHSWEACRAQVHGFPGARYQSFATLKEAEAALKNGPEKVSGAVPAKNKPSRSAKGSQMQFDPDGICVDAACSGNPGPMEYQGMLIRTRDRIFHKQFPLGTNNIGEFLAIVHALAYLQQRGLQQVPVYSDSAIALKWVAAKKCRTKLPEDSRTGELLGLVQRAEEWLETNSYTNPVRKWETDQWGEIPADFGRK